MESEQTRLRGRVLAIALFGIVPLTLLVQWSDMVVGGTMMAGPFPPLGACGLWAALLIVNALVLRVSRRTWLTRAELLLVLGVWIAANMVVGRGLLHPLLASLVGPTYYARSGVVTSSLAQFLPDWLAVTDKRAARGFFEGHGLAVPWSYWRRPLLTWTCFFAPFLTANICLCALFERVWVRQEHLSFPLVALPMELLEDANGTVRKESGVDRRALAFGLIVPLLLHVPGVSHAYIPAIPCIPFFNDVSSFVTAPPWIVLRPLYINIYPLLIGLTFLAPADITFSVWFFLLLNKVEMLFTATSGWNDGAASGGSVSSMPYLEEQSAGAYLMLGALLIWSARKHLHGIIAVMLPEKITSVLSGNSKQSPLPSSSSEDRASKTTHVDYSAYRLLAWGFVGGIVGVLAWSVWTGLPLWFAAAFFGFYFLTALVLSRLMAEGGVSWILAPMLPDKLIFALTGSVLASPLLLTRLMLHVQHLRDTRQMLAPTVMQAGKLRDVTGFGLCRFYGLMLVSVFLALGFGVAVALPHFYQYGALSLTPNSDGLMMSASVIPLTAVNQASERLQHPLHPSEGSWGGVIAGMGVTWLLSLLRTRFLGWPLHPLGYALTGTLQAGYANKMLCSIFLGWMFKTLTLRLGGTRGFRLLRGVALGLILGDLLMGGMLKLLDALLGPSGYAIF